MTTDTTPDPEMTPGRALAQWWAEQLGAPSFDNGDHSDRGFMTSMFATILSGQSAAPTPEQAAVFVEHLAAYIDTTLGLHSESGLMPYVVVSTDYHPELRLREAADAAGISPDRFPWKTTTFAYQDHVVVSPGARARHSLLWNRDGWVRPACGQSHYVDTEAGYTKLPEMCGLPRYHEEREHGAWIPDPDNPAATP